MIRPSTLLLVVLAVAACSSGDTAGATLAPSPVPAVPMASPSPASTPAVTLEPAGTAAGDGPPAAQLAAEGGDPVIGQLGTYVWGDGGSDSPWLPGTPISVGAGEPLSVTFQSTTAVGSWRARSVPSSADGPADASLLGEGTGDPAFGAPASGSWTVEVHVVFDDGVGDASYFWRLDVS